MDFELTQKTQESVLARGLRRCGFHVVILGCISAGKTTLANALQRVIEKKTGQCECLREPVEDNPLLPLYYQDPNRYAFPMQIHMLNKRLAQQRVAQDLALAGKNSVQDSSVFGDSCFVEMLFKDGILTTEEVDVYADLFANMTRDIMYPSAVVYLNTSPEVALDRLHKRNRSCESGIPIEYLANLKRELDALILEFGRYSPTLVLDGDIDMTPEEIDKRAEDLWETIKQTRNTPIVNRQGV